MENKVFSILGCGWLGVSLATHFMNKRAQVKGSTTSINKLPLLKEKGITPYLINIENEIEANDFFTCDVLLVMITSKEITAYKKLLERIENSSVQKVIFVSSTSVYPSLNTECLETSPIKNSLLAEVEELFRASDKFLATIIRFAGLFGGKRHPGNWFAEREIPYPNGFVNMIHREDCIGIISELIEQDVFGETFNACINHHPLRKEFYENARKTLGKPVPVFDNTKELQYKIINAEKLIKRLNYSFKHTDLLNLKSE